MSKVFAVKWIFPVQLDSKWYIAVINKMPDEVAKTLGSSFTLAQVHFLKTVVRFTDPPLVHSLIMRAPTWRGHPTFHSWQAVF